MAESDRNGAILRHLLTMNGPSYACSRYWDWIEPFITKKLSYTWSGKKELYSKILTNIQKIKQEKAEFFLPSTNLSILPGGFPKQDLYIAWEVSKSN